MSTSTRVENSATPEEPVGSDFGPEGHPRRWAILGTLVLSLVIVVLDNTVLNIALPTIQQTLGATQSELVWAIDSYVLVFAALLFTWGVLGDRYGRKKILSIGLVIFALGSALSAISTTPEQLIAFRAIMGIGGAAVIPVTLAIITVIFPVSERGKAIGVWAGSVGGAVALGPVLAGVLLEHPSWFRWITGNDFGSIFFINVPIVIVGLVGAWRLVPESKNPNPDKLDPLGLLLSITGMTALVYGIIHAGDTKDWLAPMVIWPIVGGLAVIVLFLLLEYRSTHSSFDVRLFQNRKFSVPLFAVSLAFFAMNGAVFAYPFYLQTIRGLTTLEAGLCFIPFAVGQIIAAPRSSKTVARFGNRAVIGGGLVLLTVVLFLLTRVQIDTPLWLILTAFLFFGFAMGNIMAPSSTLIQNSLPLDRAGAGSAVQNTVRQIFGALGIAISGTLLATKYSEDLSPALAQMPPTVPQAAKDAMDSSVAAVPSVLEQAAKAGFPADAIETVRTTAFEAFIAASAHASFWSIAVVAAAAFLTFVFLGRDAATTD